MSILLPSLGIEGELYETVAVINLDVQHVQGLEPQKAGRLNANTSAEIVHIDDQDGVEFLIETSKLHGNILSAQNVLHFTAETFHPDSSWITDFRDQTGMVQIQDIIRRTGVNQHEDRPLAIQFGRNHQIVTTTINGEIRLHLRRNIAIVEA